LSTFKTVKLLIAGTLFIIGAYFFGMGMMGSIYSVPTILGAIMVIGGLAVWTTAAEEPQKKERKKHAH
jgi:predicted tellurium resistance membrane protein TerC